MLINAIKYFDNKLQHNTSLVIVSCQNCNGLIEYELSMYLLKISMEFEEIVIK